MQSAECAHLHQTEVEGNIRGSSPTTAEGCPTLDELNVIIPPQPPQKAGATFMEQNDILAHDLDAITFQLGAVLDIDEGLDDAMSEDDDDNWGNGSDSSGPDKNTEQDPLAGHESGGNEDIKPVPFNTKMRANFHEYVAHIENNHLEFSDDEVAAIRLLQLLRQKNAPLNAYDSVMAWHLKQSGKVLEHEAARQSPHFIGRKTMLKRLSKRYNMEDKFPFRKTIKLPVSGAVVKITCHDAGAAVQRLLTDPRNKPEDYLFFGDDPRAPPPESLDHIADLNTGSAYLDTHHQLITQDGEQLMPIVLYIDGAAISQFHEMELVSVKISLGIMTRNARLQERCWTSLGYVEKVHEQGGLGRKILEEGNHLEHQDALDSEDDSQDAEEKDGVGDKNVQDWHAMVGTILESFVDLQETGFIWDLAHKGIVYEDIVYKVFVPFIRCDTKEADTIVGRYQNRTNVQQICRYCHIPLQEANDHMANYRRKTEAEVRNLVHKGDLRGLQQISQNYLLNAFHDLRFSLGNDHGVHGACPSEMLHAIQLGIFKYLREGFFANLPATNVKTLKIIALSTIYCKLFARQSDRSLPGTNFSKGIKGGGKMMAKDCRGILLVMLALFRSARGRELLGSFKAYKGEVAKDDWILLIELLLEWETYLCEKRMTLHHVKRLKKKHRYLMYVMRKVAKRTKGMGLKLMKFHAILHLVEDIISFGVPLEFDTAANESHHKPGKQAARLTQRAASTFQFQTATRLVEFYLQDLAMEEIDHDNKLWEYHYEYSESEDEEMEVPGENKEVEIIVKTGDTKIQVFRDEDDGSANYKLLTRSKNADKTSWNASLVEFLVELQAKVLDQLPINSMQICTQHKRDAQIYRGHPNYRGKGPWKDWVWVDWGEEGDLPCHIWCFVDLEGLPGGGQPIDHGGIRVLPGVYAVVETAYFDPTDNDAGRSDLMMSVRKEVGQDGAGNVTKRHFYLANTCAFLRPCSVIPDIGGPTNKYFVVASRSDWAKEFLKWVDLPHRNDEMDPMSSDEEEEDEMVQEEEVEEDSDEDIPHATK
jgi:hypothetical protein